MMEIVPYEAEQSAALPALILGNKVDGIIFMGNLEKPYLEVVTNSGIPCLLLDFHVPGMKWDCVVSDNEDGGCALAEHLLAQGYREIGFVGNIRATSSIMDRYLGYQRALRLAGIVPREDWLLEDRNAEGVFLPVQLPEQMPQAFVCNCDEVAYNLVSALREGLPGAGGCGCVRLR